MGCNMSRTSSGRMDVNSNSNSEKLRSGKVDSPADAEEDKAINRFKDQLMTQLQSIADVPPMMPLQLVDGDPRLLLVPALFKCTETLAELNSTPLPKDSNLLDTYLKSGTHWIWELMKMLWSGKAVADGMPKEMAHLEFFPPSILRNIHGHDPKVYCTHFPLWCLPKSSYSANKSVYVYRNAKDVCVSLYYHLLSMSKANPKDIPQMSFDQVFEMFMGPSEANIMGNWFDHVADYWDNHRQDANILCVCYEDVKKDPLKEIKRIDQHIGSNADAKLLDDIVSATSFTSLSKTKQSSEQHLEIVFQGSMYRKGEVGDWRNHFSEEQNKRLDDRLVDWQSERSEPVPLIFEL